MEIIIIITLCIVVGILTIGTIQMQKELNRKKEAVANWIKRYNESIEEDTKKISELKEKYGNSKKEIEKYGNSKKEIEKIQKDLEMFRAKYNETLKRNQELLLKIEENKVKEEIPKVKATRKSRKKKGEDE